MYNRILSLVIVIFFFAYLLINLTYHGVGYNDQYNALLSVATLIFGIFIAFSVFNNQTKLSRTKELLRGDDANLVSLYKESSVFGEVEQLKIQKLIDEYLIAQIDYRLIDYRHSSKKFMAIYTYALSIDPKNEKQLKVYESMLDTVKDSFKNRKLVEAIVQQKMTNLEWVSLLVLEVIIAFITLSFNHNGLISSVLTSLLVTTGVILLIVLRKLDNLRWQESSWIWSPLHNLFKTLDLLPYYPDLVLTSERAVMPKSGRIRICHNLRPYPDMSKKEIEIIDIK